MEVKTIAADAIFRVFTACPTDPRTVILDVRDRKHFERAPGHIAGAYCIRLSSNGAVLLDYSKREDLKWAADCWWDRNVIVYGDAGLKKDHPVVAFLANDKHARSLSVFREGLEAFHKAYPFLVTTSVKAGAASSRRYPSQLAPLLYLGDWSHAEAVERHAELGIKAVLTIHNHPDNLKLPAGRYTHKKIEMADVDTADIGPHLAAAYEFIETAMAGKKAVLVHCGAGVSRSAALCIAYLMRKNRWSAQAALDFVKSRRSLVAPNDGFWRTLCGLEAGLGITERSNIDAFKGYHGADAAAAAEVSPEEAAAMRSVRVTFIPAGAESAPAGNKSQTVAPAPPAAAAAAAGGRDSREGRDERQRWERSRSRERRERRRSRSRERPHDRRRSRSRDRRRSRSRSRDRRRSRSRDRRSRSRDRRRSRSRSRERRPRDSDRAAAGAAAAVAAGALLPSAAGQQQQRPGEERVDVQSTTGAVLECTREGKLVGHYVLELQRVAQEALVGRLPTCDVPLEHLSVSRAHAQFTTDGTGGLFLTDLGSAHGTNLDGVWIKSKVPKQLKVGSVLKFGASVREYKVTKLPAPTPKQ